MKSILVTGASGFIGSALVNRLQFMGYKVTQFSSIDGDISDVNFTKEYKNSNFFVNARKHRAENRSVHGVHEDSIGLAYQHGADAAIAEKVHF